MEKLCNYNANLCSLAEASAKHGTCADDKGAYQANQNSPGKHGFFTIITGPVYTTCALTLTDYRGNSH